MFRFSGSGGAGSMDMSISASTSVSMGSDCVEGAGWLVDRVGSDIMRVRRDKETVDYEARSDESE